MDDEQEARATLLQYFGALAQHWAIIVAGYGVVLFSILQFKSFFVSKGLFEVALFGLFGQAVFAASRFILHGWYCEQAVEGTLGSKDWGATLTLLGRVHASMLRQIHEKHECIMKLPPFWGKRAGWGWVVWTLVWTIPPFIVYTCGRHSTELCGFLQRFFLGCAV